MVQQVIDVGTSASDGTGDPLRDAFTKINDNFTELYSTVDNEGLTYGNIASNVAGITFNVTRYTESYTATPVLRGTGQAVGNVYVIRGNVLGGTTPLNDVFLTVTTLANATVGNVATVSAVGIPTAPVLRVNGLTGNVTLTVNNIDGAASKAYVNAAIASNVANVTGSVTDSLRANINAANTVINNHSARITTLEANSVSQAVQINSLVSVKANVSYVDSSINNALSSNAVLANVASVNANVAAANAAILLRANLSGANFSGNISANSISASNYIRTDTYFVGGSEVNQGQGQAWANPAALFFGNTSGQASTYFQLNLQNLDAQGSGDIVITADDGNDGSNYIAIGMNGSNYSDPYYPSSKPHEGYVYVTGGNLGLSSAAHEIQLLAGNLASPQISLTTGNILKFNHNLILQFSDGTIQSTAFGGNANLASINANITAANAAITSLQSNAVTQAQSIDSLLANAGIQATAINTLTSNAAVQATSINLINANIAAANTNISGIVNAVNSVNANITAANVQISSLTSNAAIQALELENLQNNAASQQASVISLQSNSSTQAVQINLLNANVTATNVNISALTSNAAIQTNQISLLNANLSAANVNIATLTSNAASQALDINNIYTIISSDTANVVSVNANVSAANAKIASIDANLGSTSTNVSILQGNIATLTATKANLISGNIQANYLIANANVKIGSTLEVGLPPLESFPGLGGLFVGNVDNSYQIVVQNLNSGSNAFGSFKILADDGDFTNNYLNIGVGSSNFSGNFTTASGDTGLPEFPHDGALTVVGGNAAIRSDSNIFIIANTAVVAVQKDGDLLIQTGNLRFRDGTVQSTAIQNVPALYANIGAAYDSIDLINANIIAANANVGSFQIYSNANVGTAYVNIESIQANLGAYQIFNNANVGTVTVNFATLNANVGAYQLYSNANVGLIKTDISTINANIGAYQLYSNANIGTISNSLNNIDANIGSYQTFANANVVAIQANIGSYQNYANANLSLLTQKINAANIVIDTKANLTGAIFSGNVRANYLLANNNVEIGGNLFVGLVPPPIGFANPAAVFTSNTTGRYILNLHNTNSGSNALSEFRATADNGTINDNYASFGIRSSTFTGNFIVPAGDTGVQSFPNDGYIDVIGGNVGIGSDQNIFLVANTAVVGLLKDSNFILTNNVALQFGDGTLFANANIGAQPYTPGNAANYNTTITNVQQALDELAARIKALGG